MLSQHPIMYVSLEKIANARLYGHDHTKELTLRDCVRYLGQQIFYKNAQYVRIAQGLQALKQLLKDNR